MIKLATSWSARGFRFTPKSLKCTCLNRTILRQRKSRQVMHRQTKIGFVQTCNQIKNNAGTPVVLSLGALYIQDTGSLFCVFFPVGGGF